MSDLHLEFGDMAIPETDADVVILAGDIHPGTKGMEWAKGFHKPVMYVAGNHEYYDGDMISVDRALNLLSFGSNVSFLQTGHKVHYHKQPGSHCAVALPHYPPIDGEDLERVAFIGATLFTDYSVLGDSTIAMLNSRHVMNDYQLIKYDGGLFTPEASIGIHNIYLSFIKAAIASTPPDYKIVLVTHHSPSERSFRKDKSSEHRMPAYVSNLEYMMDGRISLWVHGHVHVSNDYTINGTRVMSNPRGYYSEKKGRGQNEDFNSGLVVEI